MLITWRWQWLALYRDERREEACWLFILSTDTGSTSPHYPLALPRIPRLLRRIIGAWIWMTYALLRV
jgi:hypothetical protein